MMCPKNHNTNFTPAGNDGPHWRDAVYPFLYAIMFIKEPCRREVYEHMKRVIVDIHVAGLQLEDFISGLDAALQADADFTSDVGDHLSNDEIRNFLAGLCQYLKACQEQ